MEINFVIGDPSKSAAGTIGYIFIKLLALLKLIAAALRASLGHPEPYELHYVEIGNEDFFATDTYLDYRWADFVGNLSAAFPQLSEFIIITFFEYFTNFWLPQISSQPL